MASALSLKIRSLREAVAPKVQPNEVFKPGDDVSLDADDFFSFEFVLGDGSEVSPWDYGEENKLFASSISNAEFTAWKRGVFGTKVIRTKVTKVLKNSLHCALYAGFKNPDPAHIVGFSCSPYLAQEWEARHDAIEAEKTKALVAKMSSLAGAKLFKLLPQGSDFEIKKNYDGTPPNKAEWSKSGGHPDKTIEASLTKFKHAGFKNVPASRTYNMFPDGSHSTSGEYYMNDAGDVLYISRHYGVTAYENGFFMSLTLAAKAK